MENLKTKDHIGDQDINVLHIGITFDCDFFSLLHRASIGTNILLSN